MIHAQRRDDQRRPPRIARRQGRLDGRRRADVRSTAPRCSTTRSPIATSSTNVYLGAPVELPSAAACRIPTLRTHGWISYVGSLSPHKLDGIGCTICHEGQGSATDFKWASHSSNSPGEGDRWRRDYGWFANHHWIFPMNPKRFAESSCLKCHHEVVDLEASQRFPDPPAPKLLAGYDLIRQYGCYGCHEINGFDGPTRRLGPDLRTEPNYSAAAQALLATDQLKGEQRRLAADAGPASRRRQSPAYAVAANSLSGQRGSRRRLGRFRRAGLAPRPTCCG